MVAYMPAPAPAPLPTLLHGSAVGRVEVQINGCTLSDDWMSHLAYVGDHVEVQLISETDLRGNVTGFLVSVFDDRLEEMTVSRERLFDAREAMARYYQRLGEALVEETTER